MPTERRNQEKSIEADNAYRLLSEWPRRAVLDELRDGPLASAELAARLARRDDAPAQADADDIHIALHHVHLPLLREHDVIDETRGRYTRGSTAGRVEAYR
jgi:hypothetical protein